MKTNFKQTGPESVENTRTRLYSTEANGLQQFAKVVRFQLIDALWWVIHNYITETSMEPVEYLLDEKTF